MLLLNYSFIFKGRSGLPGPKGTFSSLREVKATNFTIFLNFVTFGYATYDNQKEIQASKDKKEKAYQV